MSKLTPSQEQAVTCKDRALFIQAGAGTGKTFTLTKRLAYGLSAQSGPLLESVDNVLTITFTNKAAAELLGRVRAELRAQGLEDAALLIDGAWISTIHGMCSRILSAHALEAGIDPGMPLLAEEESEALLQQAVDNALGSEPMEELVEAFGPTAACALVSQLACIVEMAADGVAEFNLGPKVAGNPTAAMRGLAASLEEVLASLEQLGLRESPSAACVKQTERLQLAISAANYLAACDDLSWEDVACELVDVAPPKGGALKKAFREDFAQAFDLVADARAKALTAQARRRLELALQLAQDAAARHQELKRARGVQDTNDLLMSTYRLLEANPSIADHYRKRFGSIMVDEFQDTDTLQVRIVESFCDSALTTLATVGDAQQSIYGFRGADLETYRSVRAQMREAGSLEVSLDVNYRSHPDILAFVESIFSKQTFFGSEFLRISAGPANVRDYPWAPAGAPRVTMFLAAGMKSASGRATTSVADLRLAEAQFIAKRFEELASKGASYGQMAILMSSTKQAGPYLEALRERGIPCAVSGGSDFYLQPEVLTMTALTRVLELPDDDQPLLSVLASPLFDISDGDLLSLRIIVKRELRNPAPDDARPKVSLFDALEYQAHRLLQGSQDPLVRAYQILSEARAQASAKPLHLVIASVLERCGWLEELRHGGAAGLAKAANIERFIDLVADFEQQAGPSAVSAGEHFSTMCDMAQEGSGAKGKPGRMVALGNNTVQVMTIHASKGLEFPIVAVAQYARSASSAVSPKQAVVLTQDGKRYMALSPLYDGEGKDDVRKYAASYGAEVDSLAAAHDAVGFGAHAMQLKARRESQEAQRLLYVALTRARDMLILVSCDKGFGSKGEPSAGLFGDVAGALFPGGFPVQGGTFALDTGCLVECVVQEVAYVERDAEHDSSNQDSAQAEAKAQDDGQTPEQTRPQQPRRVHTLLADKAALQIACTAGSQQAGDIASYSSIARQRKERAEAQATVLEVAQAAAAPAEASADAVPAERGAFATLRSRDKKPETVSVVGSAFHLVAQWIASQGDLSALEPGNAALQARIAAAARRYALDDADLVRLEDAVMSWMASPLYAQARSFEYHLSEHAFVTNVDGIAVEGFIDLLCYDQRGGNVLVVDYKTGKGAPEAQLRERYKLQASVYAYALLQSGFANQVEIVFTHPEAALKEVRFSYAACDTASLAASICE